MAAKQYFTGAAAMLATAPGDRKEIARDIAELQKVGEAVHDPESLQEYAKLDNALEAKHHRDEMIGLREPHENAKLLGNLYLILYAIGSVLALTGQAFD